jgi:REP element-mobilizing transposase RayT
LKTARARNVFLIVLAEVRTRYQFAVIGYVVMPEHVHLLLSEPAKRDPSVVVQVLKQRVSRRLRRRIRARTSIQQLHLWHESATAAHRSFWQRRFYDFNVWSRKKRSDALGLTIEKNKVNGCRPEGRRYKSALRIQKSRQDAGGTNSDGDSSDENTSRFLTSFPSFLTESGGMTIAGGLQRREGRVRW